jgi:hypothetical protein
MLPLLIDENFNQRILRGLRRAVPHLDYVIAQNIGLKGVPDPGVLARTAADGRVLVTHDVKTIPKHAYERVKAGQPMPGVLAVPDTMPIGAAIEDLVLIVECCQPTELESRVFYLPL